MSGNYDFDNLALSIFRYQSVENVVYKKFIDDLGVTPAKVTNVDQIPFLPIEAYKLHNVCTGRWKVSKTFLSSGTSAQSRSKHLFREMDLYDHISLAIFEQFIGRPWSEIACLALLPSYLDNGDSSLVYMVHGFMERSVFAGFFNKDIRGLKKAIAQCKEQGFHIVIFGVSYALMDLAEEGGVSLAGHTVIETGGMKGRRKEWIKPRLLSYLEQSLGCKIASEYGMTELTSQFYSHKNGKFEENKFSRIVIADMQDPLQTARLGRTGVIQIIDLGNIDSCAFIRTQDLGRRLDAKHFEWIGRMDQSDIRGCNLLYS